MLTCIWLLLLLSWTYQLQSFFLNPSCNHIHGRKFNVLRAESDGSNNEDLVTLKPAEAESATPVSKGFGTPKAKPSKDTEKDAGTLVYERQAKRGVPEYNIFLRPFNGTEVEWIPVGSMTIPRDTKVSKAVFDVEDELLKGTFKLYPKLKAYYQIRTEKENIFEYGYVLKAFPDEPVTPIIKEDGSEKKNFFSNWLGRLTDPIDTSSLK